MDKKVEITYDESEYTREIKPYMAYYQSLCEVFDFTIIDSVADLGCNNGRLLEAIHRNHQNIDIVGYDYFEWSKQYADASIKEHIIIGDLSKPQTFKKQYSFVNCSEVGEHIPKEAEGIFLDNLVKASSDILVLTWSNEYDTVGQHLNPQPKSYIISKLKERGFSHWGEVTNHFSSVLANKLEGIGSNWWADNMMVFKKDRFAKIDSSYFIQGISTDNDSHKKHFRKSGLAKSHLQKSFNELTDFIHTRVSNKKGASIVRVGDGDYFFLRQLPVGSATPGKRALTTTYDKIDTNLFRNLFWQNDKITISLEKHDHKSWMKFIIVDFVEKVISKFIIRRPLKPTQRARTSYIIDKLITPITLFGIIPSIVSYIYSLKRRGVYLNQANKIIRNEVIPLEAVYALVSTKWIFKNFKNQIGIIAGENKLSLIKTLMQSKGYQEYLGTDTFTDYIGIPEKGAADNILSLAESLGKKIQNSKARIFLVGAGSAKIALLPLLRHYNNAVFIDVGCGIDAIAGIVCQDRPYFAEWTNYRLKDYDYSKIDFMDQGNPSWNNPSYKTKKF